jgi:hypothetical protein
MSKKTKVYYVFDENSCLGYETLRGKKELEDYLSDVLNCGSSLHDLTIIEGNMIEVQELDITYKVSL